MNIIDDEVGTDKAVDHDANRGRWTPQTGGGNNERHAPSKQIATGWTERLGQVKALLDNLTTQDDVTKLQALVRKKSNLAEMEI